MDAIIPRRPADDRGAWRLTAAWVVLGAAAGGSALWVPPVFDARVSRFPDLDALAADGIGQYDGPAFETGRVRVFGCTMYAAEMTRPGGATRAAGGWHRLAAAAAAGLGGLAGAAVGRREARRAARRQPGRSRPLGMWAVAAGVFGLVVAAGVPGAPGPTLCAA